MRQLKWLSLLGLLLLGPSTYAQSVRYQSQAISSRGAGIANATIAICSQPANTNTQPCSPLATLATSTSTTSGGANPLTADSFGNFFFYAAAGRYTVQIYGPAVFGQLVIPDTVISCDPTSSCNLNGAPALAGNFVYTNAGKFDNLSAYYGGLFQLNCTVDNLNFLANAQYPDTVPFGACVTSPSNSTEQGAYAIVGAASVLNTTTAGVGIQGIGWCQVVNCRLFGFGALVNDHGNTTGGMWGGEIDVGTNVASAPQGLGISYFPNADSNGQGKALDIRVSNPASGHALQTWGLGVNLNVNATVSPSFNVTSGLFQAGVYFQPQATGVNQSSQGIGWASADPVSGLHFSSSYESAAGNMLMGSNSWAFSPLTGATFVPALVNPAGVVHAQTASASVLLPSPITGATIIGDANVALGTGTAKGFGVIGISRATGDVVGDRAFGGWFKAFAANQATTEVGIHAEASSGSTARAAEFAQSSTVLQFIQADGGYHFVEQAAPGATAAQDVCYGDSTAHVLKCNYNNTSFFNQTQTIGTGNVTTAGTAINTLTCQAQTGISVANSLTSDNVIANIGAALPATWQTGITMQAHVTANGTVTVYLCNPTATATITPVATQVNVRVVR